MIKTAFLNDVKKYEIYDVPEPVVPPNGLILEVYACGICGSDLRRWREGVPEGVTGIVSGHEIAGKVISVGSNINGLYKIDDRLAVAPDVHCGECYYCKHGLYNLCDNLTLLGISPSLPGGFSEKLVLPETVIANGVIHSIPNNMPYIHAALAEPASSVLACHSRINTSLGDTVVVIGGGPIGCLHVAIAKERGACVILSEINETRRRLSERFEPDVIIDPSSVDIISTVKKLTNGLGADKVICANPVVETHIQAVEMIRKRGSIVLFGGLPKANPFTTFDGNKIHYEEITVTGSFSYHPTFHLDALNFFEKRPVLADKLISHSFDLSQINEAFNMAASGAALKVMIINK